MVLAGNKKAYFDYFIEDKFEAGIELVGSEVKSAKAGKVSIKESFIRIINGEVFIMGMSIVPWSFGSVYNPEERRVRKLLLHKAEIKKLKEARQEDGISIIPLKVYIKKNHAKVLIGLAKGKKLYDKRESIKKRDLEREQKRQF